MKKDYREHYEELSQLMSELGTKLPGPMGGFFDLHSKSVKEGALPEKVKELIALGIAITVRCDGCIAFHVHDVLLAGGSHSEVLETIGVAIMMGGGPSVVYGCEALEAMRQIERSGLKKRKMVSP